MPLSHGTRLGPYEVLGALGAGGMGEVYKARDTRLERTVALKVIQSSLAIAPEMHERFQREARAISALDHPHICTLYDVCNETPAGALDAVSFLVMQYLEGETLADRLARAGGPASDPGRPSSASGSAHSTGSRGPIPFETALKYAVEIAQALDAAHRRGIVHRDLKPGNVMVTKTGTKLLDFGLAKLATEGVAAGVGIFGDGETRLSPLTGQGAILGTLYYMSPEQLEGRDVDTRSDIHAFGALLYEMLSGRRAFDAESQAGVIAAIVSGDAPSLTSLADTRTSLPIVARRALDRLLAKCLAKDPDDRWQSASDLAAELEWIGVERARAAVEPAPVAVASQRSPIRERIWMGVAAAAVLALAVVGYRGYPRPAPPPMPITFAIDAPEGETLSFSQGLLAVSPDGSRVAFTTGSGEGTHLWVRTMGALAAERVEHADGAFQPAWSPNGRSIAFTANGGPGPLRTIDLAGGSPRTLAPSGSGRPAWGRGVILFKGPGEKIYSVPEAGGEARAVMELDPSRTEAFIDWPVFLPDGRRYLFVTRGRDTSKTGLFLASLDSPGRTLLVNVTSSVNYAAGYLFYQRDGTVMAHPFDAGAGRLSGEAFPVAEDVAANQINGRAAFSVTESGAFSFVPRSGNLGSDRRRILLVDRSGKNVRQIGKVGRYLSAALSPDGRQAVVTEENGSTGVRRLSLLELERGISTPFTLADVDERYPLWSPDGASIVFMSVRDKGPGLYRRRAGGGATSDEELFRSDQGESILPWGFSSDGQRLLVTRGSIRDARIWMLPLAGDRKPVEVFPGSRRPQTQPVFSPDNKWIAYAEGETTLRTDVFVQPYPPDGRRFPISTAGGANPQWTADGRRIIYRNPQGGVMAVDCTFTNGSLPSNPVELFRMARLAGPGPVMFSMDGKAERFLFAQPPGRDEESAPRSITVVLNFVQSLKKPAAVY